MTARPDLPGFLLARAADLEAKAPDIHEAGCFSSWWEHDRTGYGAAECNCGIPARVLADCAAQRAIVELYVELHAEAVAKAETDFSPYRAGQVVALRKALQRLATVDAAHPDFDPAWRA